MSSPEFKERQLSLKKAVMFLIFKDGKFLLEERTHPDKAYFGYTIIPGGKVDRNVDTDPTEAMVREAEEEWGIKVSRFKELDTFEDITTKFNHYLVTAFLITDFNGEVINREPDKSKPVWVEASIAKELMPFSNSRYVLTLAKLALIGEGRLRD